MIVFEKISDGTALLYEGDREITVPGELVRGCSPGDVVFFENGRYFTDEAATRSRRKFILKLQNLLWDE